MFVALTVLLAAVKVSAQDQSLSTVSPPQSLPPFMDLFTSASNYLSEPIRKTYSDPGHYVSCPKTDSLTSFANVLGAAAKIMGSATIILVLKMLAGKLLLTPLLFVLVAKLGLKAFLMWPMISKMIKYFKKKKKNGHKSRVIMDCSPRVACVIQRAARYGLATNAGAAVAFSLINDIEEDSLFAKSLLTVFAGDKVAECMSLECSSGIDIS